MEGKRIRLRALRREDSELLYKWINCRELVIHNAPFYPISELEHVAWMESMLLERSDRVIFVIEELEGSKTIGTCQLFDIDVRHRSAELQIRIGDEEYQSKGYGVEAITLLCNFGFEDINLHRIHLHVFEKNIRAIKAYEKCGFEKEGLLRQAAYIAGVWNNVIVMSKLESCS